MLAVDLHYLLPTLAALRSGQSRNGLFPADLTLQLLLPRPQAGRHREGRRLLRLVERRILIGALGRRRGGRQLGVGFADVGAVVTVTHYSGLDGRVLEDLVGGFSQHALSLGLIQLVLGVADRQSLALQSRSQVAVTVDGVKVFGDGVFIIVAVRAKFLFRAVGVVHILRRTRQITLRYGNFSPN